MYKQKRASGFTLIEILIVVIILGILAAIVIPQFTEASSEARESSLVSNLQTLRSQLGLYKVQHNDEYPDDTSSATFETCMTEKTDVTGATDGTDDFGPYMQNIPDNPFITNDALPLFVFGDTPGTGTSHWMFDNTGGSTDGCLWANDNLQNPDGDNHSDL
ncbi:MAG: prepilin-type N-terminal cleavage/methylation domain-containing protein [Sedimentisphaerales bacterium]|nr:prepilin-type N-terminal cleavage/methylation domain-containing protein [Sedimentisphaerales bacterium]